MLHAHESCRMNYIASEHFLISPFASLCRRHTPYMGQPDYRIHELNKRLQQRSEVSLIRVKGPGCKWEGGVIVKEG